MASGDVAASGALSSGVHSDAEPAPFAAGGIPAPCRDGVEAEESTVDEEADAERNKMTESLLTVEISSVVDRGDVERAEQRATALRRAGYRVVPVVAGERLTQGVEEESRERRVVVVRDGQIHF